MHTTTHSTRVLALCLCSAALVGPMRCEALAQESNYAALPAGVAQTAEILEASDNVKRLFQLRIASEEVRIDGGRAQLLWEKSQVLRQILLGYLEVRPTTGAIDAAIDETYDAIDKQSRMRDRRVALANIANFTQFGILFDIAAADRLRGRNFESSVLTCVSASLTGLLSTVALGLARSDASPDRATPNALAGFFDLQGGPQSQLPPIIGKYINSVPPGTNSSRKQQAVELWKTRFSLDASQKDLLRSLSGLPRKNNKASVSFLTRRLILLYALNALCEQLDADLLQLLNSVEDIANRDRDNATRTDNDKPLGEPISPNAKALEAARLLNLEPELKTLATSRQSTGSANRDTIAAEVLLLERTLRAALEVRQVVDSIDQQKHYQIDVVLSRLNSSRDQSLLWNNTANFTKTSVLKNIAGAHYLEGKPQTATELLTVMSGVDLLLTALAWRTARGGKRKLDYDSNVLAQFLNVQNAPPNQLSSSIWRYLNSPSPDSTTGVTRRASMLSRWHANGILKESDSAIFARQLAALPEFHGKRIDTIALVNRRLRMLFDLRSLVESFDTELLELLRTARFAPWTETMASGKAGADAVSLLGIQQDTTALAALKQRRGQQATAEQAHIQVGILNKILAGALEVRSLTDNIDDELNMEYTAKEQLIARRNQNIALNNRLNFGQFGLVGVITGGQQLHGEIKCPNQLDIISGSTTLILSSLALWQMRGGVRKSDANENTLSEFFLLNEPCSSNRRFSPLLRTYLDSTAGESARSSRRERLIDRWKKGGVLTINLNSPNNLQKVAACGPSHNRKSENIKLITNRIVMLHDVHTLVESFDNDLVDVLRGLN